MSQHANLETTVHEMRRDDASPGTAEQLLPLVYDELRKLAARRLMQEQPGQTLEATALVHEAYLRLVGNRGALDPWQGRGHFFAAAAEAMRRILVENARRKACLKHGGGRKRVTLKAAEGLAAISTDELLALDDALGRLAEEDQAAADLAQLRLFAGLSVDEAAPALGISRATAYRHWTYARAWLRVALRDADASSTGSRVG